MSKVHAKEKDEEEELPSLLGGIRALDIPGVKKGIPPKQSD